MFRVAFALRSEIAEALDCDEQRRDIERRENFMSFIQRVQTSKTDAIPAPFPNAKGARTRQEETECK
jgi:hypothetical protein